jgi:hypothetical protein
VVDILLAMVYHHLTEISMQTKPIAEAGFSDYTIDTLGRVYNTRLKQYMSSFPNNIGYIQVSLTHDTKGKVNRLVHRLVAEAFIPNPDNLTDVDHIDEDKTNNKKSNLRWIKHAENVQTKYDNKKSTAIDVGAISVLI